MPLLPVWDVADPGSRLKFLAFSLIACLDVFTCRKSRVECPTFLFPWGLAGVAVAFDNGSLCMAEFPLLFVFVPPHLSSLFFCMESAPAKLGDAQTFCVLRIVFYRHKTSLLSVFSYGYLYLFSVSSVFLCILSCGWCNHVQMLAPAHLTTFKLVVHLAGITFLKWLFLRKQFLFLVLSSCSYLSSSGVVSPSLFLST